METSTKRIGAYSTSRKGLSDRQMALVEEGWSYDWPDNQVVQYAGITIGSLKAAYRKNPSLRDKRDLIRNYPQLYARKNIATAIQAGDITTSKWYLERRTRDFAAKGSLDIIVNHTLSEEKISERLVSLMSNTSLAASPGPQQQLAAGRAPIDIEAETIDADGAGHNSDDDLIMLH